MKNKLYQFENWVIAFALFVIVLIAYPEKSKLDRKENQRRDIASGKYRKMVNQYVQKKEAAIFRVFAE